MQVQLPKQDGASTKVVFRCGVSVRFILKYYSNTNQYDLLIVYDPDDEKCSCRMDYLYDIYEDGRCWSAYCNELYFVDTRTHWYNVYAYVAENDDSYDIRIKLHEIEEHEE